MLLKLADVFEALHGTIAFPFQVSRALFFYTRCEGDVALPVSFLVGLEVKSELAPIFCLFCK